MAQPPGARMKIPYRDYLLIVQRLRHIDKQIDALDPNCPFAASRIETLQKELEEIEQSLKLRSNLKLVKGGKSDTK